MVYFIPMIVSGTRGEENDVMLMLSNMHLISFTFILMLSAGFSRHPSTNIVGCAITDAKRDAALRNEKMPRRVSAGRMAMESMLINRLVTGGNTVCLTNAVLKEIKSSRTS